MGTELALVILKLFQSMAVFMVAIMILRIMFNMLLRIGNEPSKKNDEAEKNKKPTLKEYMERSKEIERMGFNQFVEIYLYSPYEKLLWIENFSINFEDSFVIVTDKHNRTDACSIDNIKKIRSTDLKSADQTEESFSSYKPNNEFWSPKEEDKVEEEDWCDF